MCFSIQMVGSGVHRQARDVVMHQACFRVAAIPLVLDGAEDNGVDARITCKPSARVAHRSAPGSSCASIHEKTTPVA